MRHFTSKLWMTTAALGLTAGAATAQTVLSTNSGIIEPSLCVGTDCAPGIAFGFDTVILKENNIRQLFDDTSSTSSFPNNDWRLTANDSTNGGDEHFSIEDASAGRFVFRVFAGARSNALVVDSQGDVGIGTSTPATDIDIKIGDSPTVRLQQDGTSGWTPQTWDLAGNETNFFVRDVTHGSKLPFRIRPDAPTSSIEIDDTGNVGFGLSNASAPIHVRRTDGTARVLIQEANGTQAVREMLRLENNGGSYFTINNTQSGRDWYFTHENNVGGRFIINASTSPADGLFLSPNGNMTIGGTLTENSDKNAKMAIEPVDEAAILDKVAALPVSAWSYKDDAPGIRHIGPMAQDFHAAFGLGHTDKGIATLDTSGVALASIKALHDELEEARDHIARQKDEILRLEVEKVDQSQRLARVETQMETLLQSLPASE